MLESQAGEHCVRVVASTTGARKGKRRTAARKGRSVGGVRSGASTVDVSDFGDQVREGRRVNDIVDWFGMAYCKVGRLWGCSEEQ